MRLTCKKNITKEVSFMKKLNNDLFRWREALAELQHEKDLAYGDHGGEDFEEEIL